MKKSTFLILMMVFVAGMRSEAQSVLTVDPATEYQTIVGLGGGNGTQNDANFLKYIVDYLGITEYRQWLDIKSDVTIDQINNGTVNFPIFSASNISYLQYMASKGVKIIASPLTPPACLKKSNCLTQRAPAVVGGPLICGQACVPPVCNYNYPDPDNYMLSQYYDEFARYMALYAMEFKKKTGIDLYAVSMQNEPVFNEPYGSALLSASEFGKVLKAVHDTFAKYPSLSGIKLFGPEHMCSYERNTGSEGLHTRYIQALLDTATYKSYLDAYAVHGYDDGIAPDLGNSSTWEKIWNKVGVEHGKELWMSETSGDFDAWANAYWYMKGMFMSFKSGKVSLYSTNSLEWLYKSGNATRQMFNHMHYYRFIRPGAKMIKVTDTDADVEAIGFKNGSDFTLVVINLVKTNKTVSFSNFAGKPAFFHVYRSTVTDMCSYVGKVSNNSFELPGESVVTITYNSASPDVSYGPLAPSNLTTTSITDNAISVSWSAVPGWTLSGSTVATSGYIVYIDGVKKTTDGPTTKTSWTFTGLKAGSSHVIEIFTRDAMINQSVSASLSVTTTCTAGNCGIGLEQTIAGIEVFPNPANDVVTLALPDDAEYTVDLVDVNGKTVLSTVKAKGNTTLDVSALPAGIYIVIANNGSKIFKSKVAVE